LLIVYNSNKLSCCNSIILFFQNTPFPELNLVYAIARVNINKNHGVAKKAVRDWMNINIKMLGIHNCTQAKKGSDTRAFCQKNEGSVEIKQRPINMGGRTLYRTLSPKRAPFQIGIN
jgi:hypothetical protein